MKTTGAMMMVLLLTLASVGCRPREISYDPRASAEYQVAWQKKIAGDDAAYRDGLKRVAARYPHSRAGVRAREELRHEPGETSMLGFLAMLAQLAQRGVAGAPPAMAPTAPTR
jgi:hypothetical protein